MYRIGIDVGGTFTDLVSVTPDGRSTLAKSPSTPADQSMGVLQGLEVLAAELGLTLSELLSQTERIVHGTTVATNALLEGKGARVGLLTTKGHRDILEMREGFKPDRYNMRMAAPAPLIPRHRRLGVVERLRSDGSIDTPLDLESLDAAIETLRGQGVEAVAVAYLHAYRDPQHEHATAAALSRLMPDAYVSLSAEVLPQIKEYERVCTTVVNAYVGPALRTYLSNLQSRLQAAGYLGAVLVMQSHGGVASIAESVRLAAGAVLSGPAGGVAGSRYAAKLIGAGNLIPFDMGGTSTDISLIVNGEAQLAADRGVGGHSVALPSLDITTLGAGGGSIARVDAGGLLRVGPQSAGAEPGPACYGKNGTAATVTDANLVLGYLDQDNFLGGRIRLDAKAARSAIDRVAAELGIDSAAAAQGVFRVVNATMAEGVRLVSVRRGVDPRNFTLLAFGGAAGLHVTSVAQHLEIRRVMVPRVAAVLSAWGMLASNLRHEVVQTHIADAKLMTDAELRHIFNRLEADGRERMGRMFGGQIRTVCSVDLRYGEQVYEISVPLDGLDVSAPGLMNALVSRFHRLHNELYTYSRPAQDVVMINARIAIIGDLPAPPAEPESLHSRPAAPRTHRQIYLDGDRRVPVYDMEALARDQVVPGPALVEAATTTVLLRSDDQATVTRHGWLDIDVGNSAERR